MGKDFDEFEKLLESDKTKARFDQLKNQYFQTEEDDSLENVFKFRSAATVLRIRIYHEWVNSED